MMDELIRRLEAATGPSRELDADIGALVGFVPREKKHWRRNRYPLQLLRVEKLWPLYTASIDAALTLAPEKSMWSVCIMEEGPFAQVLRAMPGGGYVGGYIGSYANTPALAMVIAALKARQ